jgi:endonuclease/exonuclease/phosphatase family metal-dependent hydrolase
MKSPGDLCSRHWGKATLKSETDVIQLYSAHLHPSNEEIRAKEVAEVLKVMKEDIDRHQLVIFQGDLNHEPIQNEYDSWKNAGLTDCYMKKGVEQRNTIKSTFPNRTVDYIWVNDRLTNRLLRCKVLYEGNFRTNPMDERSVALSDHLPVMAEFS